MADSPSDRITLYIIVAVLCGVVANLKGRESWATWFLGAAAIWCLIAAARAFLAR